ncbi:PAS domain S-box protein [Ferriphaselus sp. R-1]|uniref:PAS domain-containing hybrid sensor histidine kinase/response regulator n=1 Tax=Ferriphaselus sp. R-1 TaxID=1485544 RepID=UPI00068C83B5|nr:PAS domain S-box protein [Ferriphaselus sp. R-1]
MHRLLKRQLQRAMGRDYEPDERLLPLLDAINTYYQEIEQERLLLENALEVNTAELNAVNEKLRAQNAELTRTMLNTLSDGVYATDLRGNLTFMNTAAEAILGYSEQQMLGRPVHQIIHHRHPDGADFPADECPLMKVYRDGQSVEGDDAFINCHGDFIPVSFRSNPLLQAGDVIGSLVSFRDITRQEEAEARLRLQRAALDSAANMIVIASVGGVIEYVNPSFSRVTGYQPEEVVGQHSRILNSGKQDREFYQTLWQTVLSGRVWENELINRRKNGELYTEQMTITPILEGGRVTHFVAIKRDITEEYRIKTHLKLVSQAVDSIVQGILIIDHPTRDGTSIIQHVNQGFELMTGYRTEELIGHPTSDFLRGPQTDIRRLEELREAMRRGDSLSQENVYYRKDGSSFHVELQTAPVRDENGNLTHYIGVLTDISLRRQAEEALRQAHDQALEASRMKSEFLSTMSHEIRTPMNGIIGMTELLLDTELDTAQREFAATVRDSGQSLLTIINDILDFSKVEAGKMEIEVTDYSPVRVVEGAADLLAVKAREKKLSLMTFVEPELPAMVRGDPTRVRQVLLNLMGNAVKFTEQGEVVLSVTYDAAANEMRFTVRDTGIGMPREVQSRLFQAFTQADSSTTRKFGGTGLGLAISKRLVELMGGEIGVSSVEGEGSSFWFTLPCQSSEAAVQAPHVMVEASSLRVLVVDDLATDREILTRYIRAWGMHCDAVDSAAHCLVALHQSHAGGRPYDIVLLDYAMPGMDGVQLARAIRSDRAHDVTRMLMITAFDQRNLMQEARAVGVGICLIKPVRQSELHDALLDAGHSKLAASIEPVAHKPVEMAPKPTALPTTDAAEQKLILLVEDNRVNQRLAQHLLAKMGYAVHIVSNGLEAVDAAERLPYDVILMDCQMPVMDGFEATRAIRAAERGKSRRPIVAMTANAMQGDRERCLEAGMDDYLTKPVNASRMTEILARWLAQPAVPHSIEFDRLDFTRLLELFGDKESASEVLGIFVDSTSQLLARLQLAQNQRQVEDARRIAHEIKGTCANLGLGRMAQAADTAEQAAAAGDWRKSVEAATLLQGLFHRVEADIVQYCGD